MAATLNRDRDTASGVTDAPHYIRQRREMYEDRGWRPPGNDHIMRSPDGKSQRGDDGGKGIGVVEMMKRRKMEVLCV